MRALRLPLLALSLVLSGCASFSQDGGLDRVQTLVKQRTGQTLPPAHSEGEAGAAVQALLAKPLTADDAVRIALLANRSLRAAYARLGIAEADLVQAGRLSNPTFSFGRIARDGEIELDRSLSLPILGLLTMPLVRQVEQHRFDQAQLQAALDAVRIADDTRRAYFSAVAAQQTVTYMEQAKEASDAGAQLAAQMGAKGNWSKLQQARQQAFLSESALMLLRAKAALGAEREKLTRLMGQNAPTFTLPERLPELPGTPRELGDAEARALRERLDLLMAQRDLAALADTLGLTRVNRFVNVFEFSLQNKTETDRTPRARGYEVSLQLPIFDFGDARVAKAEAMYRHALEQTAAIAVNARSDVREAYGAYRAQYDIARHYVEQVLPLKKRIADEQLLRYNGMLISVFELLDDAREQVLSVNSAIEAQRDFWLADAALHAAQSGAAR